MAKQVHFVGDKYKTKHGAEFEIIKYETSRNITIKFNCGYTKVVQGREIHTGCIEYPFHKTCAGIGFIGIGPHKATENNIRTKPYAIWYGMFNRCYMNSDNPRNESYTNVYVCDEWHNYQNFANWFLDNYTYGFELDKDLRIKWSNVYSPETCSFIPPNLNKLMTDHRKRRGKYPIGVRENGNGYSARCFDGLGNREWLGTFKTPELAFQAYAEFKKKAITNAANLYKDCIHNEVYENLINWKVVPYPENERNSN